MATRIAVLLAPFRTSDLARAIPVAPKSASSWRTSQAIPKPGMIGKLAAFTGLPEATIAEAIAADRADLSTRRRTKKPPDP